jgi:Fur family peroxide stress response transcriptional regulator
VRIGRNKARRDGDAVDRWCRAFERACRDRGVRVTAQRLAVYRVLAEDASHPTAEQVYARLRPGIPSLSPATVYRVLESLEREGLIRRVSSTDGVGRFDANLDAHQHVVCRRCGRMTDLDVPALGALQVDAKAVPGFVVEGLDIRILGRCATCRPGTPVRRAGGRRGAPSTRTITTTKGGGDAWPS